MNTKPILIISLLIFAAIMTAGKTLSAQENSDCYVCHDDPELGTENELGEEISLYVADTVYAETVHGEMECISCHASLEGMEDGHDVPVTKTDCSVCHEDVREIYDESIHGKLLSMGDKDVAECSSCHGKHNIFPAADERSTVNKFNLMFTCAVCHQSAMLQDKRLFPRPEAVPHFYESVHAKGLLIDGLNVSPSCNDCHGTHDILNSGDPRSPIYKSNVYKTCGNCHTKVEDTYRKSIHGQLVESGDKRGPVCTDCHESHEIVAPDELAFKQYSDRKCGQCHEDKMERYHETFHGKATYLGSVEVATCYDCHGHHDILPATDVNSHIHPDNKVETCSKCHTGVNYNFANYIAHADHMDRENYPMLYYTFLGMTLLVIGVFVFFSFHTMLWAGRTAALFLRDSKKFREAKIQAKKADLQYVRFTPLERSLHFVMIISFITLAFSGMPIKFFMTGWAQSLMHIIGGIDNARYMHRFAAFMLITIFAIHLFILTKNFIPKIKTLRNPNTNKFSFRLLMDKVFGPDSLVPQLQDVRDFWAHQKWFFGKGPKPQFDRWTYWEKFDYFAVFWGIVIIGLSGLIMWFPTIFTLFLPGWIINLALIIHSDEALLATGFIFVFHFFNVHFRIEKFPMDTVIFSGKISEEEFLEERGAWYDRLKKAEKLNTLKEKGEWEGWQPIVKTFGFIAFGMGIVLAFGIFTAMFYRLIIG